MAEGWLVYESMHYIIEYLSMVDLGSPHLCDANEDDKMDGEVLQGVGKEFTITEDVHNAINTFILYNHEKTTKWVELFEEDKILSRRCQRKKQRTRDTNFSIAWVSKRIKESRENNERISKEDFDSAMGCDWKAFDDMARKVLEAPVEVKYTQLFINGEFVDATSGETFPTLDPRTGEIITQVAEASAEDVNRAVEVARNAFDNGPWPRMTGYERGRILFKFADLIENHSKELAALETWDNGKPYSHALSVINAAIKYLRCHAGWGDKIFGQTMKVDGSYHAYTLCEPIGVVGQITPWNFPSYMFITKVSTALICGNTVVVKPAEQTPLAALFCAKLATDAGLPAGVLNVVPGYGPVAGAAIATHMEIDKLVFTGSTEVGRLLMEASARSNLKRVTLELGGKTPLIVFQDANIDVAAELASHSVFFNMGQVCVAGTRVFVQEKIYEEFLQRVVEVAHKRVVGDPFQEGVDFGPQIDKEQFDKTLHYIQLGKEEGAKLLLGGERFGDTGLYIQPTIFADVQDSMKIAQDEIFGPVMSILKFGTVDEVVRRSNATRYGLAAGIVTKDIDTALKCSRALKSGTVWINTVHVLDPVLPFGGYKMSGFGRENGIEGLKEYMQVKSVIVSLPDSPWL